jgi:hypothetical protein
MDRESAYVHVSIFPFAYSSLLMSVGSPQIAFTSLVVIPTRGIVVTEAARTVAGVAATAGALTLVAGIVVGAVPSESNSHGKFW